MASTVHSFYQNVYLTETEANITHYKNSLNDLKDQISGLSVENLKLKEENSKLKRILERYRTIIIDLQHQNKMAIHDRNSFIDDDNFDLYSVFSKTPRSKGNNLSDDELSSFALDKNNRRIKSSKMNVYLDMVGETVKKISMANNFKSLIDVLYNELAVLLRVHKIGIFIADPNLRKLYQREHGVVNIVNLGKEYVDLAVNEKTLAIYNLDPGFTAMAYIKNGIRTENMIVLPVTGIFSKLQSEIYMAIQLEGDKKKKKKTTKGVAISERWILNEMTLGIICIQVGIMIDRFLNSFSTKLKLDFQKQLMSFCIEIFK